MSERAGGAEPFPITADPQNYVRTNATEEALEELQRRIRDGGAPVVLLGAPGVGKTLLLRVLEERLATGFRVVYLPMAVLSSDELCSWVLDLLGENASQQPEWDLLETSLRLAKTGSPLVVLLDDAGSMPVATARRLSAFLAQAGQAIRLVLALPQSPRSDQMLASFQPAPSRVELRALLTADETARYLRAHLVQSDAPPEVRARFDPISVRYLHLGSGGIPRVLSGLAGELARGNRAALPLQETAESDETLELKGDPFEMTSDPAAYVPRPATEELLESVASALGGGARAIAVTGPPGLGKTMLLRVFERRLGDAFRAVRIPYTSLLPDEFCRWILTLADEPVAADPEAALRELTTRLAGAGTSLALLLDDASALPVPTLRHLVELSGEMNGALRLVLFAVEDARTAGILDALGSDAVAFRFGEPMNEDETATYVCARLAHAVAPTSLVEYFDAEAVARLHAESDGIPREVHKLASVLYGEAAIAEATRAPAPEVPEASPEPPPPPTPPAPAEPLDAAPEPAPAPAAPHREAAALDSAAEPPAPRAAASGRLVALGLLGIATLLGIVLLLRGGVPETDVPAGAGPTEAPPAELRSPEAPAPPMPPPPAEPAEAIAVNVTATTWASVDVDGDYLGVTPLADVPLSPGPHLFRARMADGQVQEQRVEVGPSLREVFFEADLPEEVEPEPEPQVAAPIAASAEREPPAIPLERFEPTEELPPAIALERAAPAQEGVPQAAEPPEQPTSAREPEPAPPPPPPEPISVSINAMPWATIEIDGEEVGITPMAGVLLAPGDHQFRVIMPDGTVLEETVEIAPDNRHIAFP